MRKFILLLTYIAIVLCVFTACEDIIDVKLNSVEPQLVIEAVMRMGEPAEVLITRTKDFDDDNHYQTINTARITLSDGKDIAELLHLNEAGRYRSTQITGTERTTYHLTVELDGSTYTATSYLPPRVELDSITLFKFPMVDYYYPMVHFVDPAGEENQYYRFVIGVNGEWPNLRKRLLSTEFMDGNIIRQPVFVSYDDERDDDPILNGDLVTVEMRCLDEAGFTFFDTLDNVDFAQANPEGNFSGDVLGAFTTYSYTQKEILMKWEK